MSIASDKNALFDLNKKKLEKILNNVSKRLFIDLGRELQNLNIKNGKILNNTTNINYILSMADRFEDILVKSGMEELLREYANTTKIVYNGVKEKIIAKTGEVLLAPKNNDYFKALIRADLTRIKGLAKTSLDKIRDIFLESSIYEMSDKVLKERIFRSIEKNMVNYSKTYMETARGLFIQNSIDQQFRELRENGDEDLYLYEYVGADDDNVRPACRKGLNKKFFTHDEKGEFELKFGTRYNCRHSFVLILKETAEEEGYSENYKNKTF